MSAVPELMLLPHSTFASPLLVCRIAGFQSTPTFSPFLVQHPSVTSRRSEELSIYIYIYIYIYNTYYTNVYVCVCVCVYILGGVRGLLGVYVYVEGLTVMREALGLFVCVRVCV